MAKQQTKVVAGVRVPGDLDRNGFGLGTLRDVPDNEWNLDVIAAARFAIGAHFCPCLTITAGDTSYSLKQDIERVIERSITNGEFIVAMLAEAGYRYQREGPWSPNCFFNVSKRAISQLRAGSTKQKSTKPRRVKMDTPMKKFIAFHDPRQWDEDMVSPDGTN